MPLRSNAPSLMNVFLAEYVATRQVKEPSYAPPEPIRQLLERGAGATEQEVRSAYDAFVKELPPESMEPLGRVLHKTLFSRL